MRKNLLFISYNFPPTGWSGSQRIVKFIKYLDKKRYKPIVLTVPKPAYSFREKVRDECLLKDLPEDLEVLRVSEMSLDTFMKKSFKTLEENSFDHLEGFVDENRVSLNSFKEEAFLSFKKAASACFQPDSNILWVSSAIEEVEKLLERSRVDLIISSAPPYSSHLIAGHMKKKWGIPWIADFRDSWLRNPILDLEGMPAFCQDIERNLLLTCDKALFVTPKILQMYRDQFPEKQDDFHLIYNGYDEDDFEKGAVNKDSAFTLMHMGTIYPSFMPAVACFLRGFKIFLSSFSKGEPDIKVLFQGWNYPEAEKQMRALVKDLKLEDHIFFEGYVPHKEAVSNLMQSHISLLFLGFSKKINSCATGKVFEYARSGVPCLAFAPLDSDAISIFKNSNFYSLVSEDNDVLVSESIEKLYLRYQKEPEWRLPSREAYQEFQRSYLTRKLELIVDKLVLNRACL
ncbi:hypothetical protein AB751O23_AO_00040 [Chlamydiales bacterium SCGC AB-751-O23]|nr:hypothetical protein AB751O23_AO_00040 [Chlamydiales bacterium SCGC AB-751-O23]